MGLIILRHIDMTELELKYDGNSFHAERRTPPKD